jgi:hypothetical protein
MMRFDAVVWTDFACGDWQKPMQRNLGRGSKRCLDTLASQQKVANVVHVDASHQRPAETVHVVKAALAMSGLTPRPPETSSSIQLLFDSFSHAALAGIRSAGTSIRQMLYRADPYQVDIQLEVQPERNRLLVTGQLLDVSHPEIVGRKAQVKLSDGREVVNLLTNQFGEFSGEVENSGDLELSFRGLSEKPIVILLRRPLG